MGVACLIFSMGSTIAGLSTLLVIGGIPLWIGENGTKLMCSRAFAVLILGFILGIGAANSHQGSCVTETGEVK